MTAGVFEVEVIDLIDQPTDRAVASLVRLEVQAGQVGEFAAFLFEWFALFDAAGLDQHGELFIDRLDLLVGQRAVHSDDHRVVDEPL